MKWITTALIIGTTLCLAACRKHDYCPKPPGQKPVCDLVQSIVTGYEDLPENASQYRKEYDPVTGKVRKVVAGLYGFFLEDSLSLLLRYNGKKVYFISEQNATDTVLVAIFDTNDRLITIALGNVDVEQFSYQLEPATDFAYQAGRLYSITRHIRTDFIFTINTAYDANGNIVRLYAQDEDANAGTFFTYDLSVKATAQYYSDQNGTDILNNVVYLATFLGWLPDLMPVNKRLSFRHVLSDDDTTDNEPGPVLNHTDLTDHVYDSEGKLLSYKIASGAITFINKWDCQSGSGPK